jgi:hypothetical protein
VSVSDTGYFKTSQSVTLLTEAEGKLNLILTKKGTPFAISSLTGGSGILSNGSSVTFPADAFVGLDGLSGTSQRD